MSNKGKFEELNHTIIYSKIRPSYPEELVNKIIAYLKERDEGPFKLGVDIGCGSGQATKLFAPFFESLHGYDVSENQIKQALNQSVCDNIKFFVSPSERIPLEDESVNLITVATAVHWFDIEKFFDESKRLLKRNGALAVFSYFLPSIEYKDKSGELSELVMSFYKDLRPHFSDKIRIPEAKLVSVVPPLHQVERHESFVHTCAWKLEHLQLYLKSWSAYQTLITEEPHSTLLQEFISSFKAHLSNEEDEFIAKFDIVLILGRKA